MYLDEGVFLVAFRTDADVYAAFFGIFDGIVDEVAQHFFQVFLVGIDRRGLQAEGEADGLLRLGGKLCGEFLYHRRQGHVFAEHF